MPSEDQLGNAILILPPELRGVVAGIAVGSLNSVQTCLQTMRSHRQKTMLTTNRLCAILSVSQERRWSRTWKQVVVHAKVTVGGADQARSSPAFVRLSAE